MKPIKGFRLDEGTQAQIAWLSQRKNVSATDVVRMAIAEMYQHEIDRLPKFKVDDHVLYLNGKPVIKCNDKLFAGIPVTLLLGLEGGTADVGETIAYLLMNAAKIGKGLSIDELALKEEIK